jgi:hypothetical protein
MSKCKICKCQEGLGIELKNYSGFTICYKCSIGCDFIKHRIEAKNIIEKISDLFYSLDKMAAENKWNEFDPILYHRMKLAKGCVKSISTLIMVTNRSQEPASMPQEVGQKDNIEGVETHLTTAKAQNAANKDC